MINRKILLISIIVFMIIGGALSFYMLNDINSEKSVITFYSSKQDNTNDKTIKESIVKDELPVNKTMNNLSNEKGKEEEQKDNTIDQNKPTEINEKPTNISDREIIENNSLNQTKEEFESFDIAEPKEKPSVNMVNILFLGIDRTEDSEKRNISFASDTIILTRIDLDNRKMKVLSIPRDTYTHIPLKNKMDKITNAYSYGYLEGKPVKSTIETIEELFQRKQITDYYFTLDMEPVPDIIDELGGIELDVEIDMKSNGVNLSKGLQLLDGKSAFDYIHWRYGEDGDIGRIKRQHKFVMAMLKKFKNSIDKKQLVEILNSNEQYIDSDMGLEQMVNLFTLLSDLKEEDIQFSILPGEPDYINDISYWIPDQEKCKNFLQSFFIN